MGLIDRLLKIFGVKKDGAKVVCVGLDNSGKTTLLNKLKKDKDQQVRLKQSKFYFNFFFFLQHDIVPTVGFVCEKFESGGLEFTAWDFSGQGEYILETVQGEIILVNNISVLEDLPYCIIAHLTLKTSYKSSAFFKIRPQSWVIWLEN